MTMRIVIDKVPAVLSAAVFLILAWGAAPAGAADLTTQWLERGPTGLTGVALDPVQLADGTYIAYYNDIGMQAATSGDGITWTKAEGFSAPRPDKEISVSNPWVFAVDQGWRMIFEGQDGDGNRRLYSALSADGLAFDYEGLVMAGGTEDKVDNGGKDGSTVFLSVPDGLYLSDGSLRMYYVSQGDLVASALSTDQGLSWTRDEGVRLEEAVDPAILALPGGGWRMFYTDWAEGTRVRRVGYADSSDGLEFVHQEWIARVNDKSGVMVDPALAWADEDTVRLYLSLGSQGGAGMDDMEFQSIEVLDSPDGWSLDLFPVTRGRTARGADSTSDPAAATSTESLLLYYLSQTGPSADLGLGTGEEEEESTLRTLLDDAGPGAFAEKLASLREAVAELGEQASELDLLEKVRNRN